MIIHPYNRYSRGARELKKALRAEGVKVWMSWTGQPPKSEEYILNWGDSDADFLNRHKNVLNRPSVVRVLTNKLRFMQHCVDGVVPWTVDKKTAEKWSDGYARTILEGSGGGGIVVWSKSASAVPDARLYTKRIPCMAEYRIHVGKLKDGNFKVLDTQKKVFQKSADQPEPKSWAVRSHDNGFVFIRNQPPSQAVVDNLLEFVRNKFGDLDFAAWDVLVGKNGRVYVLEGNTAPGLEGQTIGVYAKYIAERIKG